MKVVIVGAHGRIARLTTRLLVTAGHTVSGVIRTDSQADDIVADGATPVVLDIANATVDQLAAAFTGNDAVIFAASAGGNYSVYTIDRDAAIRTAEATQAAGIRRLVVISTIGAGRIDSWEGAPDYLLAKGASDDAIMGMPLDWTIVRPSWLNDAAPAGTVSIGHRDADPGPAVSRADIASLLVHTLEQPATIRSVFSVSGGDTPIDTALAQLGEDHPANS